MKVDITFISKKERKSCFNLIDILHIDVNTNTDININVLDFKILSFSLNIGVGAIVLEPDFTIDCRIDLEFLPRDNTLYWLPPG